MEIECLEDYEELLEKFEGDFRKRTSKSLEEADLDSIEDSVAKNIMMAHRRVITDKRILEDLEDKIEDIDTEHLKELRQEHSEIAEDEECSEEMRKLSRAVEIRLGTVFKVLNDEEENIGIYSDSPEDVERDTIGRKDLVSEMAHIAAELTSLQSRRGRKDFYKKGERFSDQRELLKELNEDRKKFLQKIPRIESNLRLVEERLAEIEQKK